MKYAGSINGTPQVFKEWCVNDSQTITIGDIVVVASGKISKASDGATAGTIAGVAMEAITTTTATVADKIKVDVNPASLYRMDYKTGTKTSLVDTDIGTKFDLGDNAQSVDLDDTTGGFCLYRGNADNEADNGVFQILGHIGNV